MLNLSGDLYLTLTDQMWSSFQNNAVNIQYHRQLVTPADEADCSYVFNVDRKDRCAFVKMENNTCRTNVQYLDYMKFLFCVFDHDNASEGLLPLPLIILMFWSIFLIYILALVSDVFFCPAIAIVASTLHMSQDFAGVTLLALGNAIPDIFIAMYFANKHLDFTYSQLLGDAYFTSGFIMSVVCLFKKFQAFKLAFLRDSVFLIGTSSYLGIVISDDHFSILDSIVLLGLYGVYCLVVWLLHISWFHSKTDENRINKRIILPDGARMRAVAAGENFKKGVYNETLCADFCFQIKPFTAEDWEESGFCRRCHLVIKIIPVTILKFILPVTDCEVTFNGWSKLLNCINVITLPMVFIVHKQIYNITIVSFIQVYMLVLPICVGLFVLVFISTKTAQKPKCHLIFAVMSHVGSIFVMDVLGHEIISVTGTIGRVMQITDSTLSLTALCWATSVPSLVANIVIAYKGLERMAFAACLSAPIVFISVGMGLSFLYKCIALDDQQFVIRPGPLADNCLVMMILTSCSFMVMMFATNFYVWKSAGYFLLIMYLTFVAFGLLGELEIVHNFGTEHIRDTAEQVHDALVDLV